MLENVLIYVIHTITYMYAKMTVYTIFYHLNVDLLIEEMSFENYIHWNVRKNLND